MILERPEEPGRKYALALTVLVHLVLVNGRYIAPEMRASEVLHPGDALAIWPPIAGG